MLSCTAGRPPDTGGLPEDRVLVEHDAAARQTNYTITARDCKICWTVYESETNRGGIRHRSDCGLTLGEQAPLIAMVLGKVMETSVEAARFRTLSWGRLYPDGARDATMAVRLALAAKRSAEWDAVRGAPRGGDINGWTRKLSNDALIYEELRPVFREAGLEIRLSGVEKVLILEAGQLPFHERLRQGGARPGDKLPFDFQAWFSVRPASRPAP
jgi:hypothetical protein